MRIRQATLGDVVDQCGRLARLGRHVRPEQQSLAALDADGTLWGCDVAEKLWERLIGLGALAERAAEPLAQMVHAGGGHPSGDPIEDYAAIRALREAGRIPEETVVRAMLRGLAGLTETEIYEHVDAALAGAPELSPEALGPSAGLVGSLREQGYRVIIVSGSPRWAVERAAATLGILPAEILAGRVSVVNGVLTDGILEPLPWGAGKIQAILRRFGAVPRVSMGNSLGDLAMLEATSHLRMLMDPPDELLAACDRIPGDLWALTRRGMAS